VRRQGFVERDRDERGSVDNRANWPLLAWNPRLVVFEYFAAGAAVESFERGEFRLDGGYLFEIDRVGFLVRRSFERANNGVRQ
jgi:hypothetical protein